MKFLIPILIEVENVENPNAPLTPENISSAYEGVKNALSAAQANGFNHPAAAELSILVSEVTEPIPASMEGPFVHTKEFDTEPSYVHNGSEADDQSIILGKEIPWTLRNTIAKLLCPILNVLKTPTSSQA